jgi:hypothetical protein
VPRVGPGAPSADPEGMAGGGAREGLLGGSPSSWQATGTDGRSVSVSAGMRWMAKGRDRIIAPRLPR